ncbi:MAG: cadherin repeat domain-containing protein [Fibrobacteraceae bacterium]|nr:cadherin repeat domain-containing protein [Fibrobacteraceae bacterium]
MKICGSDTGSVAIAEGDSISGEKVYVNVKLDGLKEGTEYFRLYIFDLAGAVLPNNLRTGYFTLAITDVDANIFPVLNDTSLTVAENTVGTFATLVGTDKNAEDTLTYSVLSGDTALFTVSSSGNVSVKTGKNLDFETHDPSYELLVRIFDGEDYDTSKVTIRVLDVNESPSLRDTVLSVKENVSVGTSVGIVSGSDPDTAAGYSTLRYSLVSGDTSAFAMDPSTGKLTTRTSIDYETKSSYTLVVRVSDGSLSGTGNVTVRVEDVNERPSVTASTFRIAETAAAGSLIDTVEARDPDGDLLTYSVLRDTSGKFRVDPSTGALSLRDGETVDYELTRMYGITVVATDPDGLSDTAEIRIDVTDEKEVVEITYAEAGDSSWTYPDTVRTNRGTIYVEWTEDGRLRDSTVSLVDGKNVMIVSYQEGSDTLVVYRSSRIPDVAISASGDTSGRPSGVTIVEAKDAGDTASYVRSRSVDVSLSVTDSSGTSPRTDTLSVNVSLDTVSVTAKEIKTAEGTIGKVDLGDGSAQPDGEVTHAVLGPDLMSVSYYDTTASGTAVRVTYYTDGDGKRLVDSEGREYCEVSYAYYSAADGKYVTLAYTVDEDGYVKTDGDGNTLYTVSYTYTDPKTKRDLTVSYTVDSEGNESLDGDGNMLYDVTYRYTDSYGNGSSATALVVVDLVPPVVKIVTPEDMSRTGELSVSVVWTVDGVEQDTLTTQGLSDGVNRIIRTYRDKAGNEGSDTVNVLLKAGKVITVEVEKGLVSPTTKTVEKYTAAATTAVEGASYGVSFLNARTGLEEEVLVGTESGSVAGSYSEPYTGLSGTHLGPTLVVTAQVPAVNGTGTSATLSSIVENGYVSLDTGGGWDRTMIPADEYVDDYCSEAFRKSYDSVGSEASLYTNYFRMDVWVFTTLGSYVGEYAFNEKAGSSSYVDGKGMITLYFELKPDGDGYLKASDGRLLGTGAYIFKASVTMTSVLECGLPDYRKGYRRVAKDDLLESWGYKRPRN